MIKTITIGSQSITLVELPAKPGLRSVEWNAEDSVAVVRAAYTGQVQTQKWPGADLLSGTMTLPALTVLQADDWECFEMQLRGMANAFQMGDPLRPRPRGTCSGSPIVDNTVAGGNAAGSETLGTKGWTANAVGVLLRGDWIQVGYRYYRVLDDVDADASGNAIFPIYPSLREVPTATGSSEGWLNATGSVTWIESRPLAWNFESVLWSDFELTPNVVLPADAVIQGIYPVFIGSATFASVTTMAFRYGKGFSLTVVPSNNAFTSPSSPDNTTFASTEFYGASIGNSLAALTGEEILGITACSLFLGPTLTDRFDITAVGFAIYYTSATPVADALIAPPFAVPAGQGLAWAIPSTVAFTGGTGAQGTAIGTAALDNGGLVVSNPRGLFRLAQNKRTSSADVTRLTRMGLPFQEYR